MQAGRLSAEKVAWLRRNMPVEIEARKLAALVAALSASVARARVIARRRQMRNLLVVPGANPARHKLDRMVPVMVAAGWSFTRIARAYGVQRPAVVKWLQRRARPQGVAQRRPAWVWRMCARCRCWAWYRMTTRRRDGLKVYCSFACYRLRGRKAKRDGQGRAVMGDRSMARLAAGKNPAQAR